MTVDSKRIALALFFLAAVGVLLIAAALPLLELQPGVPLPDLGIGRGRGLSPEPPPVISISFVTLIKTILIIVLLVMVVHAGYRWRKQISWKEILVPTLCIAVIALIGLAILFALQGVHINFKAQAPEILPPEITIEGPPLGPVSPNLIWLVWIGLAAGLILFGARILFWTTGRSRPEDAVEREAEQAIRALQTGSDIKNVIVRCYLQMSLALQKERGIKLEATMTARDFERLLEARGIPHAPVHQLTRLFEEARYGHRPSGSEDERNAFDCLNAIVQYSRAPMPPS
jgi:hypothetical protein